MSDQNSYTESVKACQSGCASLGGPVITERRHSAAGCQSKDLYRAVAAAETDIGRHGVHDKSWWTGGRLEKRENSPNRVDEDVPVRDSPSVFVCKLLKQIQIHFNKIIILVFVQSSLNIYVERYHKDTYCFYV